MANEFTDSTKAAIFARDRATCCFSGANLWLLDAPLRCGWQTDWADHIKPRSRGGCSEPKNGVCASHTFNAKKRNNTADTTYLFRDGHPTSLYYDLFGSPPQETIERLQRLASLEPQDWYFNRAIKSLLLAFDSKWAGGDYKRTPAYWFDAAYKKLVAYQKFHAKVSDLSSLKARKIIVQPGKSQKILLSLRHADSLAAMKRTVMPLYRDYRMNSNAWWNYFSAENEKSRRNAHKNTLSKKSTLSPDVWKTIQTDFAIRHPDASSLRV